MGMEHNTSRKVLTIEEHVVTFGKMDLVEVLDGELAGEGIMSRRASRASA